VFGLTYRSLAGTAIAAWLIHEAGMLIGYAKLSRPPGACPAARIGPLTYFYAVPKFYDKPLISLFLFQ
jgi:hypothetical protein